MAMNPTTGRRVVGAVCLGIAVLMLLGGETVLQGRLRPAGFLLYWLVCIAFTGLAVCVALLDAWAVRRRTRQEERELLSRTFREIATRRPPPKP